MLWQRIRIALLTGALVAATGLTAWAAEDDKDADKNPEKIGAPKTEKDKAPPPPEHGPPPASPCGAPCGTRTVWVNEWVPEQYPCTRTVYSQECRTESYTAYRTECVPETRTRTVTTYRKVCETVNETRTTCVNVPCVEERTVMKSYTVCKPVTTVTRKCEDHGHYECREVPCGPSMMDGLKKCFHHKKADCCDPCATECCEPVKTKTVKVWVPCPVWVETPCTKMVKVTECRPEVVHVTVCKKEFRTEVVPVTRTRCIPECHTESYTVNVSRCVPYPATRTVTVCVPHTETYTATRMVCRKVAKEVPVVECCASPCDSCCEDGGHKHHFFHK
jgi:hypothetical protein